MGTANMHLTPEEEAGILKNGKSFVFKSHPHGRAGDTFSIDGRLFELIDISERPLGQISLRYHVMDGSPTPSDFISRWKAGHSSGWDPEEILFVHWFREITRPLTNDLI